MRDRQIALEFGRWQDGRLNMRTVEIANEHQPSRAEFWGRFPTEIGPIRILCSTVALFRTESGQFFAVAEGRTTSGEAISATTIDLVDDPRSWLKDRVKFLESQLPPVSENI